MAATRDYESSRRMSLSQLIPVASHVVPGAGSSFGASGGHAGAASSSSSILVNPTSLALALPHSSHSVPVPLVDVQALQYLALEMPHTLQAGARRSARRRRRGLAMMREAGFDIDAADFGAEAEDGHAHTNGGDVANGAATDEDAEVIARLEAIGSHVGATFAERLSRDRPPCATPLDVLKFICKDMWLAMWEKQVDNLRTNHRGVYVLQDNVFKPLLRLSVPASPDAAQDLARITRMQLAMPSGMIRGALARLGVSSTVVAETNQIPQCTFHIKTATARS